MHRLRERVRVDRISNEIRVQRPRFGRWLYLTLLFAFFLWLADTLIGPMLRLQADGLVVAEQVSVGVPFTAQVKEIIAVPGTAVTRGDVLARVVSVDLTMNIAALTARNADLLTRRAEIDQKARVAESVLPIARDRAQQADLALSRLRTDRGGGLASLATWSQALAERYLANERVAELRAQAQPQAGLAAADAAIADTRRALDELQAAYRTGVVIAPEDGIVGLKTARPGDVLTVGEPVMVLYLPHHYVLAYLETGSLYSVSPGDEVQLTDGFLHASGQVADVLLVAERLPEEFGKVFQPRDRSQVAHVELGPGARFPLFAKVRLSGIGWLSAGVSIRKWLVPRQEKAAEVSLAR